MSTLIRKFNNQGESAVINLYSDGWSGEVVHRRPNGVTPMYFQFDLDFTWSGDQPYDARVTTLSDNKGFVTAGNDAIIGISLEHMGEFIDGNNQSNIQFVGISNVPDWDTPQPSFGGDDNELNVFSSDMMISHYSTTDPETGEVVEQLVPSQIDVHIFVLRALYFRWEYIEGDYVANIVTDLPIFETDAHLLEYVQSGGTITNHILNIADEPTPEEEYLNATRYWFIKNRIGHNTRVGSDYTEFRNYRFYPLSTKKICWYPVTPTASHPYNVKLKGYTGYNVTKANTPYANDDGDFSPYSGSIETDFLRSSIQFASNDFYTCYQFMTNIPKFDTEGDCDDYIAGLRDITSASNWQDIARIYDEIIRPPYGDEDQGNDNGVNGQSYVQGVRMYVLSSTELNTFFNDIFDPDAINDLLHGLQLFGTNQISCIQSLMYLPLDADDIATVNSSDTPIKLGSYTCEHATGHYVQNNNKMIDCGGFNCVRVYGDFRDYEIQMVLQLPYIGFRDVKIADLLEKYVSFKYSVDITSGACSCHVYADGIEIACYDGNMGSQRPIQSIDQQTYLSNILGAVTGVVTPIPDSISGKAGAVTQAMTGDVGGAVMSGVSNLSTVAVAKTALNAFGLEQTVKDVPMNTRGAFAGCLGYFAWQKIHIHTYISKSYKPANALQNIGAPSGIGQNVGLFSGFLSVSFFQIADGFTGTETELAEIYDILTQGIYL